MAPEDEVLFNGKKPEVTLICQRQRFIAHKEILCSGSSYFEACLENGYSVAPPPELLACFLTVVGNIEPDYTRRV